jgi:hypothetical protein
MTGRWIVPALVLGAIGLGVVWFFNTFERVPAKHWVGAKGEALRNPFLAAERFFERMGMRAAKVRSLPELDALPANGVLLAPNGRQGFDAPRIDRLLKWIDNGGHAIIEAERQGVPDPLLDALGIAREAARDSPKGTTREVVTHKRGRGLVSVAASLHFARNASIGKDDNAEFLWNLATLSPASQARFLLQPRRLSLWTFLTENALPVLVTAGLLLAAWLWRIAPRFGPVAPDLPPARRRLLDHLRASGRYYWTKGLRSRLVVAARDAALRRIARAQPDFATASQAEKISRLSSLVKISEEEASRFLGAAGAMRGADFIRVAQHAQRVHSALEKGDK